MSAEKLQLENLLTQLFEVSTYEQYNLVGKWADDLREMIKLDNARAEIFIEEELKTARKFIDNA